MADTAKEQCPNCGTVMVQDEFDTLRCGKCGWIKNARPQLDRGDKLHCDGSTRR